ncbi:MAG: RNA ligase [Edafosvirus sp.]|uniref:RNA ligase n=1 Tax=Edafosvirus sp. TaxID=2487765 RepID=A0A3G4ZUT6_9VIRU|nr:MAG: RNA ligase [Edafosvirus sp.]
MADTFFRNCPDEICISYKSKDRKIKKDCAIYRECRQLVLGLPDFQIVARSFSRFFDLNENADDTKIIKSAKSIKFVEKHDGSIIMIFNYKGIWRLVSRGSFGENKDVRGDDDKLEDDKDLPEKGSLPSWQTLFENTIGFTLESLNTSTIVDNDRSYIFELCTKYNRVVRPYNTDQVFLLASRSKTDFTESTDEDLDTIATSLKIKRPQIYSVTGYLQAIELLNQFSITNPMFEGVIAKVEYSEGVFVRAKLKTESWELMHKSMHKSKIILTPEMIIQFYLNGSLDKIINESNTETKKEYIDSIILKVNDEEKKLITIWNSAKDITNQAEFAIEINKNDGTELAISKEYKSILFKLKKNPEMSIRELWKNSCHIVTGLVMKFLDSP